MVKTRKVGSAGRFGPRYGASVKKKLVKTEKIQRKKQKCPFCQGIAKRLSRGIWRCKKCKKKFASGTYFIKSGK